MTERPPAARPPSAGTRRERPDARPMRFAFGMAAIAGTSAIAAGLAVPAPEAAVPAPVVEVAPAPSVRHVIRYVQLAPGQTAPPQSTVEQLPAPSPIVKVITTTRQSGKP